MFADLLQLRRFKNVGFKTFFYLREIGFEIYGFTSDQESINSYLLLLISKHLYLRITTQTYTGGFIGRTI